jgi:hypothetical protein
MPYNPTPIEELRRQLYALSAEPYSQPLGGTGWEGLQQNMGAQVPVEQQDMVGMQGPGPVDPIQMLLSNIPGLNQPGAPEPVQQAPQPVEGFGGADDRGMVPLSIAAAENPHLNAALSPGQTVETSPTGSFEQEPGQRMPPAGTPPGLDVPQAAADPETGLTPLPTPHYFQSVENASLEGQLERQRNEAYQLGGEEPPMGDDPGTMQRIFDFIRRPNYAMAGGMRAQQEYIDENEDAGALDTIPQFFRGAREGLRGDRKETFADVLENAGVENSVVKGLGGFILDVALDPTTYVGGGLIRASTQASAAAAGAKAAASAATSSAVRKGVREEVMNRLTREIADENLARLAPKSSVVKKPVASTSKMPSASEINRLVNEGVEAHARSVGRAAEEAATTAGKVQFRFAGMNMGESESLYRGFSKLSAPVRNMPTVKFVASKISPKAEKGDIWQIARDAEGMSIGTYFDFIKPFRQMTKGLNGDEAQLVTRMVEGTRHSDDPRLVEIADHVRNLFKNMWEAENFVGIHGKNAVARDNYVYLTFNRGQEAVDKYKRTTGLSQPSFARTRKIPTVDEAIAAGMNPRVDIREIVAERAAKHFAEMTHHGIMMDAMENFGVRLAKGTSGTAARHNQRLAEAAKLNDAPLKEVTYRVGGRKGADAEVHRALFPEPVADVLESMQNIHHNPKAAQTLMRHFDKIHQNMKFWLTVANPGHHIRNFYGNAYMAYQDGVRNPKRYLDAFTGVRGMNAPVGSAMHKAAQNKRIAINNGMSSLDEIAQLYRATGTKSGFMDMEFPGNFASKTARTIRQLSTEREDIARMGHFIDALKKSAKRDNKNWSKMTFEQKREFAMEASRRVRKFQLDYGDLTHFEKNVSRRLMMFYTFARKNTMLQLEMLATRPGKIARVPQAMTALERMMGTSSEESALNDEAFYNRIPQWIRDGSPVQFSEDGFFQRMMGRDQAGNVTDDPIFAMPLIPTSDLNRIQGPRGMVQQLISELRPELKIPIEQAMGVQAFSGAPTPDAAQTITQATPITNLLQKTANAVFFDDEASFDDVRGDWLGYVSGVGMQRTTPQRQASELRRRQQLAQELLRELRAEDREEFEREIRERRGG